MGLANFIADQHEYWKELFYNGEKVRRGQLANDFQGFAFICICEAISLYLIETEDKVAKGKPSLNEPTLDPLIDWLAAEKAKGIGYSAPLFEDADSLPILWGKAAQWFANTQNQQSEKLKERKSAFHQWWLRAVMARGHAEWLIQELSQSPGELVTNIFEAAKDLRFVL